MCTSHFVSVRSSHEVTRPVIPALSLLPFQLKNEDTEEGQFGHLNLGVAFGPRPNLQEKLLLPDVGHGLLL